MKSTKKSLLLSVLSLLLCVSMLLGTTFAWFTDSVTSGRNTITAGNLDVELYHNGTEKIDEDTDDLFDVTYWEPGVVCYENFTVANVGSLALKYRFKLNTFRYNTYNGHDLTEVLKVAVVDGGFTGDRADAQDITDYVPLADFNYSGNGWLEGGQTGNPFGVVIYWEPTDHDNDYNVNNYTGTCPTSDGLPLFVEFGVNLIATQKDFEADSFDNTYDLLAGEFAETSVTPIVKPLVVPVDPAEADKIVRAPADGESLTLEVDHQDMTVTYTVGTKLTDETAVASDKMTADAQLGFEYKSSASGVGVTVEAWQKLAHYDLTLNIAEDNTILNKVTKKLPTGLSNVVVYHNSDTPMVELASDTEPDPIAKPDAKESYYYDPATGTLTIWVFHASEVDVKYDEYIEVSNYQELQDAIDASARYIRFKNDITDVPKKGSVEVKCSTIIDGYGFKLTHSDDAGGNYPVMIVTKDDIDVKLTNLTIIHTKYQGINVRTSGVKLEVNKCDIDSWFNIVFLNSLDGKGHSENCTLLVNDSKLSMYQNYAGETNDSLNLQISGINQTATIRNTTFNVAANIPNAASGIIGGSNFKWSPTGGSNMEDCSFLMENCEINMVGERSLFYYYDCDGEEDTNSLTVKNCKFTNDGGEFFACPYAGSYPVTFDHCTFDADISEVTSTTSMEHPLQFEKNADGTWSSK